MITGALTDDASRNETRSLIVTSKANGTHVYNREGNSLGSIYDVMINKRGGMAEYAILSFGGFLGMGKDYHPLPWQSYSTTSAWAATSSIWARTEPPGFRSVLMRPAQSGPVQHSTRESRR